MLITIVQCHVLVLQTKAIPRCQCWKGVQRIISWNVPNRCQYKVLNKQYIQQEEGSDNAAPNCSPSASVSLTNISGKLGKPQKSYSFSGLKVLLVESLSWHRTLQILSCMEKKICSEFRIQSPSKAGIGSGRQEEINLDPILDKFPGSRSKEMKATYV